MPKRYTSRELIKLAKEYGWEQVSIKGDHYNFKHEKAASLSPLFTHKRMFLLAEQ